MTALVLVPAQVTDYALRSIRYTIVEGLIDDARLTGDELRARLERLSPHAEPGLYIEHLLETWARFIELDVTCPDSEMEKDDLRWKVDQAIRDLVTPASAS